MRADARRLFPTFYPVFVRLTRARRVAVEWLQEFWHTDFRKRWISWTRFREKRLSLRGFLSFDLGARLRTYLYLAVAVLCLSKSITLPHLVRVACRAIEEDSLPRYVWMISTYEKAEQVTALQAGLMKRYDADRSGDLGRREEQRLKSETGLSAEDLAVSCIDGDLGELLAAAQAQHILPQSITDQVENAYALSSEDLARQVRRQNLQKGMQVFQQRRDELHGQLDRIMASGWAQPKDYLKWETWKRGATEFYYTADEFVHQGLEYALHPRLLYNNLIGWLEELRKPA